MTQPVWITSPGNLGTVQEGKFFQVPLQAVNPLFPDDPTKVRFTVLSGRLPDGVRVSTSGLVEGVPTATINVQGIPFDVGESVTSNFSIRAFTFDDDGRTVAVNDRTFSLTIIGDDIPEFITPAGSLGTFNDSEDVAIQIEFIDEDPSDIVVASVISGRLPPGLSMSTSGLITGNIQPIPSIDGAIAGFSRDGVGFDKFPFEYTTVSDTAIYEFTVKITDGKNFVTRTFNITTLDAGENRRPFISNYIKNIGSYLHLNFFAYKFNGVDYDGDQFEYVVASGTIPVGLTLDKDTGWFFGNLASVGITQQDYDFVVRIRKVNKPNVYRDYDYRINIYGDIDPNITWITNSNLGIIDNGSVSTLSIQAVHIDGIALEYRLKTGVYSKLPQGLSLLPSGNIVGRVSFNVFSLDGGTTTFDRTIRSETVIDETTFDRTFTFTAEAFNSGEFINISKQFTVVVNQEYLIPAQSLRIEATPPTDDRALITSILQNQDIFTPAWIYRKDDPNFGVAKRISYTHAHSLRPSKLSDYIDAMVKNHYWKRLILGELKTARAVDDAGNVLYEVVYSTVVDDQVNNNGTSTSKSISLKYPAVLDNNTQIDTVYPNSLANMRDQMYSEIPRIAQIFPRWMFSQQEDGTILGFTPAWVLAYTVPGKAKQILYKINQQFGTQLNKIDFDVDRYIVERQSATNWDFNENEWVTGAATTFDRFSAQETVFDSGSLRFISNTDISRYTDIYDKYIIFPQRRIIDNGESY